MNEEKRNIKKRTFDPVTFGMFLAIGSVTAFVFTEYAALLIALGVVLGLTVPVRLSRWIKW